MCSKYFDKQYLFIVLYVLMSVVMFVYNGNFKDAFYVILLQIYKSFIKQG